MESLFEGRSFSILGKTESIVSLVERYQDIEETFPDELKECALPYFVNWPIEKVHLVEIKANSDEDAYAIFETMNDRGLSLSTTDMLKGYLLANIDEIEKRSKADQLFKKWLPKFGEFGKETESDFLKYGCVLNMQSRCENAKKMPNLTILT